MYDSDMKKIMLKYRSTKKISRAKAIRIYCREMCCAGDLKSWRECNFYSCSLWKFRLGRESLAKPQSFQKQRKLRGVSSKNATSVEESR